MASKANVSKFTILGNWPGFRLPFLGNISKIRPSKTPPLIIFLGFCGQKTPKTRIWSPVVPIRGAEQNRFAKTESVELSLELN